MAHIDDYADIIGDTFALLRSTPEDMGACVTYAADHVTVQGTRGTLALDIAEDAAGDRLYRVVGIDADGPHGYAMTGDQSVVRDCVRAIVADLVPATVTLDSLDGYAVPAFLPAYRWNGWECPYFRLEDVRTPAFRAAWDALARDVASIPGNADRVGWYDTVNLPSYSTAWEDGPEEYVSTVDIDGRTYVTIGWAAFCWYVA